MIHHWQSILGTSRIIDQREVLMEGLRGRCVETCEGVQDLSAERVRGVWQGMCLFH
jgi:hypothetical protein